ncbi:hypothetical protein [Pseudotabrizicola sp. L79]|uniref:hypothetical protein n=1 Tax=Pseudotabrizicola sp. L79 TaxID=3118402 RepID=UPI002F9244F2
MSALMSLLTKFGLFAPKAPVDDAFDLRLTRLQTREARRDVQGTIFVRGPL